MSTEKRVTSRTAAAINTEHSVLKGEQEKNEVRARAVGRSSYLFLSVTAMGHPSQKSCHDPGTPGTSGSLLSSSRDLVHPFCPDSRYSAPPQPANPCLGLHTQPSHVHFGSLSGAQTNRKEDTLCFGFGSLTHLKSH